MHDDPAPRQDRWIVGLLCAVAAVLTIVATWRGPGIGPDSIVYLSTGSSLTSGAGLVTHEGEPLTLWPPGLPALVAAGSSLGLTGETTSRILNVVSVAVTVALAHLLLRRVTHRRSVLLGATALVAVSPVLEHVASMVLTEAAFIPLTLAAILVVTRAWARGSIGRGDMALLVLLCWVGFLLRYAGAALIGFAALAIFTVTRGQGTRRAAAVTVGFAAAAAVVPVGWLLRNRATDGTLMGPRIGSDDTIVDVAHQIAVTLGRWLLPGHAVSLPIRAVAGAALVIVLAIGLSRLRRHSPDRGTGALVATLLFVAVFTAYLIVAKLTTAFEPLDTRLMSALAVPLLVLGAVVADHGLDRTRSRRGARVLGAVLLVFLAGQAAATVTLAVLHGRDGRHYAARPESPLTTAASGREAIRFANDPGQFWNQTRIQPVFPAPRRTLVHGIPVTGELERFAQRACGAEPIDLVWYDTTEVEGWYGIDEIAVVVDLTLVTRKADGALYRVAPRPGECAG